MAKEFGNIVRRSHGGYCCGMTHILTMGGSPANQLPSREKREIEEWRRHLSNGGYPTNFNDSFPKQTAAERLKMMVERIENGVGNGILEIVVTATQAKSWRPVLEELRFREVNTNLNSNSLNHIIVFHQNSGAK